VSALGTDLRAELETQGLAVLEGALSATETDELTDAVDGVVRARRPGPLHELAFLGLDERFLELVDHPAAFPLVTEVLGRDIYVYHCHLDVHPASVEPPRWRWHQDGGRQNVELESPRPMLSLKVGYFLTDVDDVDMGPLWVIPGSHRCDTLERPDDGSLRPPGAEPLLVRRGTAVVFDRRLWHARGDNSSEVTRKALFVAYSYRWVRPRDDLGVGRELLERVDPVRRQLLGAGTSVLGHWLPTEEDVPLRMR
jgi:ectoine hydroxylase-related dioxygenase (phytanoyl-CoA dioxygenase family)